MPIPRSITVDLTIDTERFRHQMADAAALLEAGRAQRREAVERLALDPFTAALRAVVRVALGAEEELNRLQTDARDLYYTARDLTEEPR